MGKEELQKRKKLKYQILEEDKTETSNKAQIKKYVAYQESSYSKNDIQDILLEVYFKNRKRDDFEKFDSPTVIAVYLFKSNDSFEDDKSSWIAMLQKGPN